MNDALAEPVFWPPLIEAALTVLDEVIQNGWIYGCDAAVGSDPSVVKYSSWPEGPVIVTCWAEEDDPPEGVILTVSDAVGA